LNFFIGYTLIYYFRNSLQTLICIHCFYFQTRKGSDSCHKSNSSADAGATQNQK